MLGGQSSYLTAQFETKYRFTGVAASREINAMVFAGTTPFIATALVSVTGGSPVLVIVYVLICQLITIVSLLFVRRVSANRKAANDVAVEAQPGPSVAG